MTEPAQWSARTRLGQQQLPGKKVKSASGDNDLTEWLVRSMQAERLEVIQLLETRHATLIADWSQIRSHANLTFVGGTTPSSSSTPEVTATTLRDKAVKDRTLRANGISLGGALLCTPATPPLRDVDDCLRFEQPSPHQEIVGEAKIYSDEKHGQASPGTSNFPCNGLSMNELRSSPRPGAETSVNAIGAERVGPSNESQVVGDKDSQESMKTSHSSLGNIPTEKFVNAMLEHQVRPSLFTHIRFTGTTYFSVHGIRWFASSPQFEIVFGVAVVLSGLAMALQVQYEGLQLGYEERFPHHNEPAAQRWPGMDKVLSIAQLLLGICFLVEIILKMICLRANFCKSCWNWFDTVLVCMWILYEVGIEDVADPSALRLLRLARILRMIRLARTFAIFDVLHLMVGSINASAMVLFWSMVFLFFLMLTASLGMHAILSGYMRADDSSKKFAVYQYFGTFTRGMVTMWEITLGNWVPVCRLLMDNVSEWFALLFLLWRAIVGFAIITTIRGVFLHETFKAAQVDEHLMIMQKQQMLRKTRGYMMAFFAQADTSGDGFISLDEFLALASNPKMKAWIAAMDLDVTDAEIVFSMLDDGDGLLSVDELLEGFARIRGNARSLDVCQLAKKICRIEDMLKAIVGGQGRQRPAGMNVGRNWSRVRTL